MSTALSTTRPGAPSVAPSGYSPDQIALIKRTVARGASDDELQLFLATCRRLGLDPFARQIFSVRRWNGETRQEESTTQTGIDGLRVVAERTGLYMPGPPATYTYDREGRLLSARVAVLRWSDRDQAWHEVTSEAWLEESIQTRKDGTPTRFWARMPRLMLAKVAEAAALRRAFPQDLSGIYAHDEMPPTDEEDERPRPQPQAPPVPAAQASRRRSSAQPATATAPQATASSPASPPPAPAPSQSAPPPEENIVDAEVEDEPATNEEPATNSPEDIGWPGPTEPLSTAATPDKRPVTIIVDEMKACLGLAPAGAERELVALAGKIPALVQRGDITADERAWAAGEYKQLLARVRAAKAGA